MIGNQAARFAEVQIASGVRLHCAEYGNPDGAPILFLHGWPDSWFSFSLVLACLPEQYRAIAIDQRGFGDSDHPDSGYTMRELAGDVVGVLDALLIKRAVLVGHSFGSFVARQTTIAYPGRVAALVLIGTGFKAANDVTRELQNTLHDLPDPIPLEFARDFQASTAYRPLMPAFFDRLVVESLKLPPRLWRVAFDRLIEYDDAEQLERITAPTLLLWGERDALFSRMDQDRFKAVLPAARLIAYEETGHCPNWECPERVATDIVKFLAEAPTSAR